jgi:MoxR-like ATPase
VHEDFRVIALGVPAPPFPGRSLDPPLRSRFQIRRVDNPSTEELYEDLISRGALDQDARLCATISGAMEKVANDGDYSTVQFPSTSVNSLVDVMKEFPRQDRQSLLFRAFPLALEDSRLKKLMGNAQSASKKVFWGSLEEVIAFNASHEAFPYQIDNVYRKDDSDPNIAEVVFSSPPSLSYFGSTSVSIAIPCGRGKVNRLSPNFVQTAGTRTVLSAMMQEHSVGRDIVLVSPKGEGKNAIAQQFASLLGYETNLFSVYKDMTSRDLLVRRSTDKLTGETRWEESPLLKAARLGELCILDGIEKLRPDVLSSLQSLVIDREASLPDGRRLLRHDRAKGFETSDNLIAMHPSFRIVALASLTKDSGTNWISADVMSMFSTIVAPSPTDECIRAILKSVNPKCPDESLNTIMGLSTSLTEEVAEDCGVAPMSTRNLIRIVRRIGSDDTDLHSIICSVLVANLLPPAQRAVLKSLLEQQGIRIPVPSSLARRETKITIDENTVIIGDFKMQRGIVNRPEMVPFPSRFFDIPSHMRTIQDLLHDWSNGERAILLLGNQGVGKNMIVDRLCQIANWEREYIQLHRDSTIGQMTLSPSLEDGKIVWKDSPLVRAAREGCALVVDEADKSPVEVISVLKALVEDGELLLADGRRLSRHQDGPGFIKIHPNFTLWVLANRPGFPFLGNDFFREVGDCFSTRIIPNPDLSSEMQLLQSYAPEIHVGIIRSIAASFADLRRLFDHGDISYPYSAREAVAVVRHLDRYPDDDIVSTLHNVLDFDSFDEKTYAMLAEVFRRHGIPATDYPSWREALIRSQSQGGGIDSKLLIEYLGGRDSDGHSSSPPPLSMPKRGKWDEDNEVHVGGNQWAGGTGGSDTAGIGGRGGPYRLDRGHKVHQVSDEAKAQVSEEATRAARAIARKALKERLEEIGMSQTEWEKYQHFAQNIRREISDLRGILKSVVSQSSERGWVKRQSYGEIDDAKLIDGVTGDKHIYKRRGTLEDVPADKPKRLRFVMDCSGSMYRFNGYDERLQRCLETTLLIMESFDGVEARFDYSIVGHSGESSCIRLVDFGQPPKNENERMRVLQTMVAHSQYCMSGDNTLEAIRMAISDVAGQARDDEDLNSCIVVGVSDANLARYGT